MPPQAPPSPPAPRPGRTGAIVVMAIGTALYALSLLPWLMMLVMSPMLFDSDSNAPVAWVIILALLGWPVTIVAGLIVGWWKRTVKVALIALAIPLAWALLMVGVAEAVNPAFFNVRDFLPEPVVVEATDATLAGMTLQKTTRDEVHTLLGNPEQTLPPSADVPDAFHWEYPSKGVTVEFADGKVVSVAVAGGFTGETARGLRIGDPMDRAHELYGAAEPTGTSYNDGAVTGHSYGYHGDAFDMSIRTRIDGQEQVNEISIRSKD